ncbi:MAG: hypothetical protein AAF608_02445 [Pseudomonadota bacterium]
MKPEETVTTDLARFGFRELERAAALLTAYCSNPPEFLGHGVHIAMNRLSGEVFLSDEDFAVGMLMDGEIKQWHFCPECGSEGFAEDLPSDPCCQTYLKTLGP